MIGLAVIIVLVIVSLIAISIRASENKRKKAEEYQQKIQKYQQDLRTYNMARQQETKLEKERKFREIADVVLHEKLIVLDVETQYLSSEVDEGWDAISEFLVSVAVTWDKVNGFRIWHEKGVENLLVELKKFVQILTFNGNRFDFEVR